MENSISTLAACYTLSTLTIHFFFPYLSIIRFSVTISRTFLLSPRNSFDYNLSEPVPQEEEGQRRIYQLRRHCFQELLFCKCYVSLHRLDQLYNYSATLPLNAQPYSWQSYSTTDILQVFQPANKQKQQRSMRFITQYSNT